MRKTNSGGIGSLPAGATTKQWHQFAAQSVQGMVAVMSGWPSPTWEPSPADVYPQAAEWALKLLELSDRGEVSLEPTETAIHLGELAKLSGWPEGSVVCLTEDHEYLEKGSLSAIARFAGTPYPDPLKRLTLPALSVGIVVAGGDPSCPTVGFGQKRPYLYPGVMEEPGRGYWDKTFSTRVRVPFHALAVLREPDGEALGVDYLSEGDQRKMLLFLTTEEYRTEGFTVRCAGLYARLTKKERKKAILRMGEDVFKGCYGRDGQQPRHWLEALERDFTRALKDLEQVAV